MIKNNFLSVGMFQLKLELASDFQREYLIENDDYHRQVNLALQKIANSDCDIIIFPEMSYHKDYENEISNLSLGKIIIFGSIYENGNNVTKVFQDGGCRNIIKRYPSGAEPMSQKYVYLEPEQFISKYLEEHTFSFNGINVYVLNCLEYYQVAYYIARNQKYNSNTVIFCCPCSNSNTRVFLEESIAIHNHNEFVYTFMCNTVSMYNNDFYGDGQSYIWSNTKT